MPSPRRGRLVRFATAALVALTGLTLTAGPALGVGGDLPVNTTFTNVTDAGCGACVVQVTGTELRGTHGGAGDTVDTAYGRLDFGGAAGWDGRLWVRSLVRIPNAQTHTNNLSILHLRSTTDALIFELVLNANRQLVFSSPAGGLRSTAIAATTITTPVFPNNGTTKTRVEVSALRNNSVIVRIDGVDRLTLTGLTGATSTNPRYLRVGIDNQTGTQTGSKTIYHDQIGVSSRGWLGERTVAGPSSPITFIHDDLGRLTSVVDPDGDTGNYSYDAAGNLLQVTRASSYTLTVKGFTPKRGVAGDAVTIYGTGFSATPAQNTVRFGTVTATVTAATRSKLTVSVPPSAVTATVSVQRGTTTATSAASFTVGATAPTIGAVSIAKGDVDQVFTITGTRFETTPTHNNVTVNGTFATVTAATATQLTLKVPIATGSGPVAVSTPGGRVVAAADLYVPPHGATAADYDKLTRVALGGAATVSQTTGGKRAQVIFTATRGKRVAVRASAGAAPFSTMRVLDPNAELVRPLDGTEVDGVAISSAGGFFDVVTVPHDGTYAVDLLPSGTTTGSSTITTYDVPPDAVDSIVPGGATKTITTTVPGQDGRLTFTGAANQRVSMSITGVSMADGVAVSLLKDTGVELVAPAVGGLGVSAFIDTVTLPAAGTYTILVNPVNGGVGNATIQLHDVPADLAGPIQTNGTPVSLTPTVPGQNAGLTFSATAGQIHSFKFTHAATASFTATVRRPNGQLVGSASSSGTATFLDATDLPDTGTYTLQVNWNGNNTGTVMAYAHQFSHLTGSIAFGGAATNATIAIPGQNATYTLAGTAGQKVSITAGGSLAGDIGGFGFSSLTLSRSNGATVASIELLHSQDIIGPLNLPVTDTYTLVLDPIYDRVGTVPLQAYLVNDTTAPITIGGAPVGINVAAPGQISSLTFTGSVGQSLRVVRASSTIPNSTTIRVKQPDTQVIGQTTNLCLNLPALTQAGTHAVEIDPVGTGTGTSDVTLAVQSGQCPQALGRSSLRPAGRVTGRPSRVNQPALRSIAPGTGRGALTGVVRATSGKPLAGVTLRVGSSKVRTGRDGRFRLPGLSATRHELTVDGRTAAGARGRYGQFLFAARVLNTPTTPLPHTIWLRRIDHSSTVKVAPVLKRPVTLRSKEIPGLEVRIPAGVRIVDPEGRPVRKLSLSYVPPQKAPFPLPRDGSHPPTYFTVQPANAQIIGGKARIIYPNFFKQKPGTKVTFWHYEPDEGWYEYGTGRVTSNGKRVVPDKGVGVEDFHGAMIIRSIFRALDPDTYLDWVFGDPVDGSNGAYIYTKTDLALPDTIPVSLGRVHYSRSQVNRQFGVSMTSNWDYWLALDGTDGILTTPQEQEIRFTTATPGPAEGAVAWEHTATGNDYHGARIVQVGLELEVRFRDGRRWRFGGESGNASLIWMQDRFGNRANVIRNPKPTTQWQFVTPMRAIKSPNGRWIRPTYNTAFKYRIDSAVDNLGRSVTYGYDAATGATLTSTTDAAGFTTNYTWAGSAGVATVQDGRGITYLTNQYDGQGRVILQTQADSTTYQFAYTTNAQGRVTRSETTDPRGQVTRADYDADGAMTTETRALGTPQQQITTFELNGPGGNASAIVDPLNRRTELGYDTAGNSTGITELAGTAAARTSSATYQAFDLPSVITLPDGRTMSVGYNAKGAVTRLTDGRGKDALITPGADGQPTQIADPLGHATQLAYEQGAPVQITDATQRVTRRFLDAAGRQVAYTDASGRATRATYNAFNDPVVVTNPIGGTMSYLYDNNGNVTRVTNELGKATNYTYDNMDRLQTRTDQLLKQESFAYDPNGNLLTWTDRMGRVTQYQYDPLDRATFVGFNKTGPSATPVYHSTIAYTYDAGDRLRTVSDSQTGLISLDYDDLDRLTQETTPAGTVGYAYDTTDRPAQLTFPGEANTTYTYDNADRLTQVTRGGQSVTPGYDDADRLTSLAMPGITQTQAYDDADRLTQITYANTGGTIGQINYAYDPSGLGTDRSGTFARVTIPDPLALGTFNDANRLTSRGGAHTYNDVGQRLTEPGRTYTWSPRNELTAMTGTGGGTYAYDGLGRRTNQTVSGQSTTYQYALGTAVREVGTGGAASATYLTSPGGFPFTRTEVGGSGQQTYLTAQGGDVLGTATAAGVLNPDYTYTPTGKRTPIGAASTNPLGAGGQRLDPSGAIATPAGTVWPDSATAIAPGIADASGGNGHAIAPTGAAGTAAATGSWENYHEAITELQDAGTFQNGPKSAWKGRVKLIIAVALPTPFGKGKALVTFIKKGRRWKPGRPTSCPMPGRPGNSFTADTRVLMADGTWKPISSIREGEYVQATDPDTGRTSFERVTHTIKSIGHKTLIRITLAAGGVTATVTATDEHPFWNRRTGTWTNAIDLKAGDKLGVAAAPVSVVAARARVATSSAFNLTVTGPHTYLVAGPAGTPLLVHNFPFVRYGEAAESADGLGKGAAAAEAAGFPHGVSVRDFEDVTKVRHPDGFGYATADELADAGFDVEKTGGKRHYTVRLPRPVTPAVADAFNKVFRRKSC